MSDRVHEDLWLELYDIVQEAVVRTIQEKEMQKGKMTRHWLRKFEKLNENENYI